MLWNSAQQNSDSCKIICKPQLVKPCTFWSMIHVFLCPSLLLLHHEKKNAHSAAFVFSEPTTLVMIFMVSWFVFILSSYSPYQPWRLIMSAETLELLLENSLHSRNEKCHKYWKTGNYKTEGSLSSISNFER